MDRQGRRNKRGGKLWLKVNGLLYKRQEKSLGTSLGWSYSSSDTEGETKAQLGGITFPFGSNNLPTEMAECWAQKAEGNPSFSRDIEAPTSPISGRKGSHLGTRQSRAWVVSLKIKLSIILSPLTELSVGVEGTQISPGPKHPKVTGKGLAQFQPSDDKWETGCPNDISHPRDGGRVRAARAAERARRCEWRHA